MTRTEIPYTSRPTVLVPLAACLLVILYFAFLVFRFFLLQFTVAAALALFLWPLQRRLTRSFGGRRALAAAAIVALCAVTILLPVGSLGAILGSEAGGFFEWLLPRVQPAELQRLWTETLPARFPLLSRLGQAQLMSLVSEALSRGAAWLNALIQGAVAGITTALVDLILFLMMLFFLLRDGPALREELKHISPLTEAQEEAIFDHLARTVKGVLQAMAVVPLVQGLLAMLGFWLFGVPDALLWGVMVILAALIPLVGSPLAWVPACVYLLTTGATLRGLGMFLWGFGLISTIDNVVKPLVLRDAAQIHPLLGFLSIIGGVFAFGAMGFLVGPVVLSLMLSAVRIYRLDILRPRSTQA